MKRNRKYILAIYFVAFAGENASSGFMTYIMPSRQCDMDAGKQSVVL